MIGYPVLDSGSSSSGYKLSLSSRLINTGDDNGNLNEHFSC